MSANLDSLLLEVNAQAINTVELMAILNMDNVIATMVSSGSTEPAGLVEPIKVLTVFHVNAISVSLLIQAETVFNQASSLFVIKIRDMMLVLRPVFVRLVPNMLEEDVSKSHLALPTHNITVLHVSAIQASN